MGRATACMAAVTGSAALAEAGAAAGGSTLMDESAGDGPSLMVASISQAFCKSLATPRATYSVAR